MFSKAILLASAFIAAVSAASVTPAVSETNVTAFVCSVKPFNIPIGGCFGLSSFNLTGSSIIVSPNAILGCTYYLGVDCKGDTVAAPVTTGSASCFGVLSGGV
ncbi:hypothetical protein BDP27DRAFT_1451280 [Rhodocollybia butyracea]|uniref:Uncharacterized protein n=1 Tax=Rhodocollybia butyracea TaxID=206335 RepID=A0A9P5PHK2_9AGAR|nr:hypothetical protein BDP27DRAFT_1451280 [Rhodocollybia butyracea]